MSEKEIHGGKEETDEEEEEEEAEEEVIPEAEKEDVGTDSSCVSSPRSSSPSLNDISRPSSHEAKHYRRAQLISSSSEIEAVIKKIQGQGDNLLGVKGLEMLPSEMEFDEMELEEVTESESDSESEEQQRQQQGAPLQHLPSRSMTSEVLASVTDDEIDKILKEIYQHDRVIDSYFAESDVQQQQQCDPNDAMEDAGATGGGESSGGTEVTSTEKGKEEEDETKRKTKAREQLERRTGIKKKQMDDDDEDDLLNHWHRLQRVREEELSRDEKAPAAITTAAATTTTKTRSAVPSGLSSANEGNRDPSTGNPSSDHSLQPEPASAQWSGTTKNPDCCDAASNDAAANDAGSSTMGGVDPAIGENLTDEEKAKFKAQAENQCHRPSSSSSASTTDDLAHIEDADLKAAILKVRKLDRILARKVRKERKIKRERIQLMRKLRQELENMAPAKGKEEKENNMQFLALTLPESHSRCLELVPDRSSSAAFSEEDVEDVEPIFETQIPEFFSPQSRELCRSRLETLSSLADKMEAGANSKDGSNKSKEARKKKAGKKKKTSEKDFLSRNKELAAEAGAEVVVRMTEEEKKRLLELLADVEAELSLETIDEADEESHVMQEETSSHPLATLSGEGYLPTEADLKILDNIEKSLKNISPYVQEGFVQPVKMASEGPSYFLLDDDDDDEEDEQQPHQQQQPQQQQQQPQQQLLLLLAATLSQVLYLMPPVCFPSNMEARLIPAAPLLEDSQNLGALQGLTSLASMCRETGETAMRPLVLSLTLQVDLATNLATIMESKACMQ